MTDLYSYRLFGLQLQSEIELPELLRAETEREPDIIVRRSRPNGLDGSEIMIEGVARYVVSQGREVWVEPAEGAPDPNVRLFLLGSAMGLLLHQRGDLPLHANAVEVDGAAFAFMGPSGSGKSTLAGAFHDHGFRVIADDVCVVRFSDDGSPIASPGIPRLRLWETALQASGRSAADFQLSYAGDEQFRKFDVPVGSNRGGEPIPLAAVFLLSNGDGPTVTRLYGVDAVEAIYVNTYRGAFAASEGTSREHWESSLTLVRSTPIFIFSRPLGFELIEGQLDYLLDAVTRLDELAAENSSSAPPQG